MKKFILKGTIFLLILGCMIAILSPILVKKYEYQADNAAMEIAAGFYAEPENSLDVLYLGPSYVRNAISPLEMWHSYGITGYSRASSMQSPVVSYYLLKEAFRTQSPKVVVLEAGTLARSETSEANNYDSRETKLHEVIDFMKLGPEKLQLAHEIVTNSNLSYFDLLVPFYRFHERWLTLNEADFDKLEYTPYAYKGQYPALLSKSFSFSEDYMTEGSQEEDASLDPTTVYYVEKMQELCEENDAELVLVRITNSIWDDYRHNLVAEYAESRGLNFLDYCTDELRTMIRFNPRTDTIDGGTHFNIDSAAKLSRHLGQFLQETYCLEDKRGSEEYAQWDEDYERYQKEKVAKAVANEGNLSEYLDLINRPNYLVMVASKNDTGLYFTDEIYSKMKKLGFQSDLSETFYSSYIGVAQGGECIHEEMAALTELRYSFDYDDHVISLASDARRSGSNINSIILDGEEVSKNQSGLNFVVFDTELDRLIDQKAFNIGYTGSMFTEKNQFASSQGSLTEFLSKAVSDRYTLIMSVKCEAGATLPAYDQELLQSYGAQADLSTVGDGPYIAIWDGGDLIYEDAGESNGVIELVDEVAGLSLDVRSSAKSCRIYINGEACSKGKYGCNFGVYDKYTGRIAGMASFTYEDLTAVADSLTEPEEEEPDNSTVQNDQVDQVAPEDLDNREAVEDMKEDNAAPDALEQQNDIDK